TYRRKDFAQADGTLDEAAAEALSAANARLVDVCVNLMRRGKNLAIFPESERSARIAGSDPSRVNPLKDGIARMYLNAVGSVSIAIVPLGLCYSEPSSIKANRHPKMVIGEPLRGPYDNSETLMADLAAGMQSAQSAAFDRLHAVGRA
ncbi:MAG: hypothetical protein K2X91_08490, partial [Thermoleophilia bacterium]|nr:hypothetical protein [Thermoleophilia bacterium]